MAFITTGDFAMPSLAICAARFADRHNVGVFGEDVFANTYHNQKEKPVKTFVTYSDATDGGGTKGGVERTLAHGNTWYVDKLLITATGKDSAEANAIMRKHINFLCSVRGEPVHCEEDGIWYYILHVAMIGRVGRSGRNADGLEQYNAALRVLWRPMSNKDPGYYELTGFSTDD